MKPLCTILARAGSKGLPGKNLRPLLGIPLVAHSVRHAVATGMLDVIAASSDSDEILSSASDAGATHLVRRPDDLASDTASKLDALRHCIVEVERMIETRFDIIVDLDPTAPLRLPEDVIGAVALQRETDATSVITGSEARKSPYFNLVERRPNGVIGLSKPTGKTVHRRQDAPACFDMNAAVYVWKRDALMNDARVFYDDTRLFEMPPDRSHDIDTPLDFDFVSMLLERREAS